MVLSRSARPFAQRAFGPIVRVLVRLGVSADAVTWTGTALTVVAALTLVPAGHLTAGALVLTVLVIFDNLDGQIARLTGTASTWGAFLDSTLDRVADAAIFGALAWWALTHLDPPLAGVTAAAAVASATLALVVSYAKARAEAVGLSADVGLAERVDRLVVVLLAMLLVGLGLPAWVLTAALVLIAVACAVTVGQRMATVHRQAHAARPSRTAREAERRG